LIFGVIIDTFADLRSEKQQKEEILKNTCFICGKYMLISFIAITFQIQWFPNIIMHLIAIGEASHCM